MKSNSELISLGKLLMVLTVHPIETESFNHSSDWFDIYHV